ncbi:MAG: SLBB domain-containing protein [Pyrinomonadaceae bacterium]
MKKYPITFLSILSALLMACGAHFAFGQSVANGAGADQIDLVHFGDVIDIDVIGGFEFDWRGRITPEGFIDGLSGISEPVYALCRSEEHIAEAVALRYSKILRDPKVAVRIIDRSDRALARLDGAVRTPSRFRIKRKVHLRELLVLSGGLIDTASGEISIFRPKNLSCTSRDSDTDNSSGKTSEPADNTSRPFIIKISELLKGGAAANPEIVSGDLISVLTADPVYVIGAVNYPRPISTRETLTVSRAVAMAGGLGKDADGGKVTILRREAGETKPIEADLRKIKNGESVDELLQPFDIIDVAAKGGQKRKFQTVTGRDESRVNAVLPLRIVE